jgi:anti-sigma factor RsiW
MLRMFRRRRRDELLCVEFVEVVTDYLDGVMPPAERARLERHLRGCPGCTRYLEQIRTTITLVGRLTEDDVDALGSEARDELLTAFRAYRSGA